MVMMVLLHISNSNDYDNKVIHHNLGPLQSDSPEEEELRLTLNSLSAELHKLDDIHWICPLMQCSEEVRGGGGAWSGL